MIRWIKNTIGSFLGYGSCPNCGDSWWWKSDGSIPYSPIREREIQKIVSNKAPATSLPIFKATYGVMMCTKCIEAPNSIEEKRIAEDLRKYGWEEDDVAQVVSAIKEFKTV